VYPREIVKRTLQLNAAALILAHNHPSGITEPSEADRAITRRLIDALKLIDVRVLDHFIIGGTELFSFAEHSLL
jgi:DNA repair protein RadC